MKTFQNYNQQQMSLIPQTFGDWLSPDHIARYINDIIDEIDISEIHKVYETELRGVSTLSSPDDAENPHLWLLHRSPFITKTR